MSWKLPRRAGGAFVLVVAGVLEPGGPAALFGQEQEFRRGDSNADSRVDVSDPIFTLRFLFDRGSEPPCMDAADANDDGRVDVADASRFHRVPQAATSGRSSSRLRRLVCTGSDPGMRFSPVVANGTAFWVGADGSPFRFDLTAAGAVPLRLETAAPPPLRGLDASGQHLVWTSPSAKIGYDVIVVDRQTYLAPLPRAFEAAADEFLLFACPGGRTLGKIRPSVSELRA